jgi:hypothetical protein
MEGVISFVLSAIKWVSNCTICSATHSVTHSALYYVFFFNIFDICMTECVYGVIISIEIVGLRQVRLSSQAELGRILMRESYEGHAVFI